MTEVMVGEFAAPNETMALATLRFLKEHVITEENGDKLASLIQKRFTGVRVFKVIPIPAWLIASAIDRIFPEDVLKSITALMVNGGLIAVDELRKLDSPFIQD